jgi:hypothetical protein
MMWARSNYQPELEIVDFLVTHTGLVAAHTENLEIVFPWESNAELLRMAHEKGGGLLLDCQTNVVGGEAAWDISCHYTDLQRLA